MGTSLRDIGQHDKRDGPDGNDERRDSGFDDLLCNTPETILVGFVVAFVNGKVEPVGTVDLDVYQARAAKGRSALLGNNIVAREAKNLRMLPPRSTIFSGLFFLS